MPFPEYKHWPLELVVPDFDSPVTDLVIELDLLRKMDLKPSAHPFVFRQFMELFGTIESVGSARIEGNRTRIIEVLESGQDQSAPVSEGVREIRNLEQTLAYVDEVISGMTVHKNFICEIHRRIMDGLTPPPNGDGDHDAGEFRKEEVHIPPSTHLPPPPWEVPELMEELFRFLETEHPPKFDLIKAAMAHHRFVWIHPFNNGNGRTVRILTYALLIKYGFRVGGQRIINPAAVFCADRIRYYAALSQADAGRKDGILNWCRYVLNGLSEEIKKTDRLADHLFLKSRILVPAIDYASDRHFLSDTEARLLKVAVDKPFVQAADFRELFRDKLPQEVSRQIKKLRDMGLLVAETEGGRKYLINVRSPLLRPGILNALDSEGFLPENAE